MVVIREFYFITFINRYLHISWTERKSNEELLELEERGYLDSTRKKEGPQSISYYFETV